MVDCKLPRPTVKVRAMASDRPLVSIVIVNFNYERYLAIAIASALGQTYDRCQVVVVDDGSTDGSRSIIAGFGDRVRAVYQENLGQTRAYNAGYAATDGEIVMFLDADDLLCPHAAEEVVAAWRPGIAKVQFCLALIGASGQPKRFVFPYFPPDIGPARVREQVSRTGLYLWPPTSGNAFARAFLDKVMPVSAELFPNYTDGALNTIAPLYGDIVSINKPLAWYRVHDSNMQNAPLVTRILRGVRSKRREAEFLCAHAAKLRVDAPSDPLDQLFHLEGRIALLKLAPDQYPFSGDTLPGLLRRTIRKLAIEEDSVARRVALLAWLIAVVLSPRALCARIVEFRFVPGARPDVFTAILQRLGIVRRPQGHDHLMQPFGRSFGTAAAAVSNPRGEARSRRPPDRSAGTNL
jgi:hypothetical protein